MFIHEVLSFSFFFFDKHAIKKLLKHDMVLLVYVFAIIMEEWQVCREPCMKVYEGKAWALLLTLQFVQAM